MKFVEKLVEVLALQIAEFMTDIDTDLRDSGYIQTASSGALSDHARDYDLTRQPGETDEELRNRITLQIAINRAESTVDDMQDIIASSVWLGAGVDVGLVSVESDPGQPAFISVIVSNTLQNAIGLDRLEEIIRETKPAGVGFEIIDPGDFGYIDIGAVVGQTPEGWDIAESGDPLDFPEIRGYDEGRYAGVIT